MIVDSPSSFFPAALQVTMASLGMVGGVLGMIRFTARPLPVSRWPIRFLFVRREQYDYAVIIRRHLERFNRIRDRRELFSTILTTAMDVVSAEGASLLIRETDGTFQLKAAEGVRPLGFDIVDGQGFFTHLEKARTVITREFLIQGRPPPALKNVGLRYCVQFHCEACLPLFVDDRLFAILNLGRRRRGCYDEATGEVLELLGTQFATAIHNATLYQAVVQQNQHLQEMGKLKNQILANVSHELRTPLTSIIGLTEIMAEGADGAVNDEQREHLEMIRCSGLRLLETVSSLLELSKIASHQESLAIHKFDLRRLVGDVVAGVAPGRETPISVELDAQTPGVYGDETKIRQVLRHLLENAVKFTRRGRISVAAEKTGEMLKVCIQDTGIGIAPDQQQRIFEIFTQADGSLTREYQGLGVGLTLSRRIVELHGGRMWLVSRLGQGSRFYFTLPLKPIGVHH